MFELIDKNIGKNIQLTPKELELFHSLLQVKKFKKKQFLLQAGEVCHFTGFITKGCIKNYIIDKKGNEFIMYFAIEDWWVGDITSFFEQKPGTLFIETIEDTELLMFDHTGYQRLINEVPKFERHFRILIQRSMHTLQLRFFHTLASPAEERYLEFLQKYPHIVQRVPQQLIASYIGVTPEFLSKIRHKLAKKTENRSQKTEVKKN
jgi:CRP-like cAMP-binding protein